MRQGAHTRIRVGWRPGFIPGRRRVLPVALAVVVVALVVAPGALADSSNLPITATVYQQGGSSFQDGTTIGQLESNACPTYSGPTVTQISPGNSPSQGPPPEQAWTLGSALGCLPTPVSVESVNSVVVIDEQGQPQNGPYSLLNGGLSAPNDLSTPSDFLNSAESPLIYSDGTNLIYQRPQRFASDTNATDEVTDPQGLALEVFEGTTFPITIAPSSTSPAAGQRVSFTVTGVPAGDQVSYAWNFGGGATNSTSPTPNVKFATAGVLPVTLTVTDKTAGSVGVATTTITVGNATPTRTSTTPIKVGPTQGKGGTVGAPPRTTTTKTTAKPTTTTTTPVKTTPAKTTPARTTPTRTAPTHTTRTRSTSTRTADATPGAGGPGGAGGAGAGDATTTTPAAATTTTPATTPRAHATPQSAAPPHKPTHKAHPKQTVPTKTAPTTTTTPQPTKPSGQRVSGLLLASLAPVPAGKSSLTHPLKPAAATAAPLSRAPGASPWAAIAGGAAVLLLLVLGATRELGPRLGGRRGNGGV